MTSSLSSTQTLRLFRAALDNSNELMVSAQQLALENRVSAALGLAELALEELGKSFSCLAFYSVSPSSDNWGRFWKDWKNHDVKAHRAFLYEFFCTLRFEIDDSGKTIGALGLRKRISLEKELAFYVDIDLASKKIFIPSQEINIKEALSRITSLMGLFNAASYICDWMLGAEPEQFKSTVSEYAYNVMTTQIYQQEIPMLLAKMDNPNNSARHDALIAIGKLFLPQ